MGCGMSVQTKEATVSEASVSNAEDANNVNQVVQILILGPSNSGKSSFLKQVRLIYVKDISKAERLSTVPLIVSNLGETLSCLLRAMYMDGIDFDNPRLKQTVSRFLQLTKFFKINMVEGKEMRDILRLARRLWADDRVKEYFNYARHYLQLVDMGGYFLNNLQRISQAEFVPNDQDMLHARRVTTGSTEIKFVYSHNRFLVIDVGGMRDERKKWIQYFNKVGVIFFCASLADYNLYVEEDPNKNAMYESLELFDSIVNSPWLTKTPVILFLNKNDIFAEKIKRSPITDYFPDYKGDTKSYDDTLYFLKQKFLSLNRGTKRPVYTYVTCAFDTEHVKLLLEVSVDILLKRQSSNEQSSQF